MSRTDGLTLTGTTTGGTDVFVIQLNPATATYTVDMIGTVDVTTDVDFSSGGYDFAGGNTAWNGFIPASEALGGVVLDNNSPDLLLTPERAGLPFGTINTTANAGGVGGAGGSSGNNVGSLETFRIDFVTDLSGNPAGSPTQTPANRDHVFDGHYTINGVDRPYLPRPPAASSISRHSLTMTQWCGQRCGRRRRAPGDHRNLGELWHRLTVLRPERSRTTKL